MDPGIDPKIKGKSAWKISKKHENAKRKPSAKTLKTMLPCWRGTLLAKSAVFKKIPEAIQIKHKKHTKIYPNIIKKYHSKFISKMMQENTKKYQ